MTIKLIVGLGNPGEKYNMTRHNVGAWYVNLLSKFLQTKLYNETNFCGYIAYAKIEGVDIRLLIPNTFINLSGKIVTKIATFHRIDLNEILIAHDELSFLPGDVKFKFGGSHGGHNGLKSIIHEFNNDSNFYRLRFGIGHPGDKRQVISFLLNQPSTLEKEMINKAINKALFFTKMLFRDGLAQAINCLHSLRLKNL